MEKIPAPGMQLECRRTLLKQKRFKLLEKELIFFLKKYRAQEDMLLQVVGQINRLCPEPDTDNELSSFFTSLHFALDSPAAQRVLYKKIYRHYLQTTVTPGQHHFFLPHPDIGKFQSVRLNRFHGKQERLLIKSFERYFYCLSSAAQAKNDIIESLSGLMETRLPGKEKESLYNILNQIYRDKKYFSFSFRCMAIIRSLTVLPGLDWDKQMVDTIFAAACDPLSLQEQGTLAHELMKARFDKGISFLAALTQHLITTQTKQHPDVLKVLSAMKNKGMTAVLKYRRLMENFIDDTRKKLENLDMEGNKNDWLDILVPGYPFFVHSINRIESLKKPGIGWVLNKIRR
jgi:hypothetical protein